MSHLVTMNWHVIWMLIARETDDEDSSIVLPADLARRGSKRALEGESSRAVIG